MENPDCRFLRKNLYLTLCIFFFSNLLLTNTILANTSPTVDDVMCDFSLHDSEGFEASWGSLWLDGGGDCIRNYEPAQGGNASNYCIRLRDNTGVQSSMYTSAMSCSAVQEIKIDFMYLPESMETGEDFLLECSTDGGASFWTVKQWFSGSDFYNGQFYNESVSFPGSFTNNTVLRFRCDASSNYDKIYLDEINVYFCSGTTPPVDPCANLGGDSDNDGHCDHNDCKPNNAFYPATPGAPCNDGNNSTENDVVTTNGCGCAGTLIVVDPCASLGGDSDNDGYCDHQDCHPNNANYPATPGTPCNDGNANTDNDVITADGCGCTGTPTNMGGGPCQYVEISHDGFESGWGFWNDGGSDCARNYELGSAAGGSNYCAMTRDNSGLASSIYSNAFDCSTADEIMIDFWYAAESMEYGEDFYLELSTDGGTSYTTIQQWARGQHFSNGYSGMESVTMTGPFSSTCVLRLRCDASSNYDKIYFDDITIKICEGGVTPPLDPCASLGGDSDNDGTCNHLDCAPHDAFYPATPGVACNDGNSQTENDQVTADGCGCSGTVIVTDPCAGKGGDSDNDGTCDVDDCQPHNAFYPATPGAACNDGNSQTENDLVTANGCGCSGTVIVTDPCAGKGGDSDNDGTCDADDCQPHDAFYPATPGAPCSDNNANTIHDFVTTDGCGCSGTVVNTGGGPCQYVEISHDGFESGWGFWNDGGSDCARNYELGTAAGGSNYCAMTRDNSGLASSLYSNAFDCSTADEIMIDFWYAAESMEYGEDFYLELSTDGGTSYTTIQQWARGQHFSNGYSGRESVTMTGAFSSTCVLRLRCDASSNYDKIYFDDITIKVCQGGGGPVDPCAGQGGDTDGDGYCDQVDCQPNNSNFPASPGAPCNDGNANTDNDIVTADGCGCSGTPVTAGCNLAVQLGPDVSTCWTETTFSPQVTGESSCVSGCTVTNPSALLTWNMDQCHSLNDGYSLYDYSEFHPYVNNQAQCASVSGHHLYRKQGMHSCSTDFSDDSGYNGNSMCISFPSATYNWQDDNPYAVRLRFTLAPQNGDNVCLSKLHFREKANESIPITNTSGGINRYEWVDYPHYYGVRVTVGGQEVFQKTGIPTSNAWSLENIDFSGADLCYMGQTTFEIEILPYAFTNTGRNNVWDLDQFRVKGGCCTKNTASSTSYVWSGPNGYSSNNGSISVIESGTYSVTVTDCDGCTAVDHVTLNSDVFTINCPADAALTCLDSTDPSLTGTATTIGDNCGAPVLTYADSPNSVCGSLIRTWTAAAAGKTRDCVQNITVDAVPATINCNIDPTASSPFNLGCNPALDGGIPTIVPTQVSGTDCSGSIIVDTYVDDLQTIDCGKILTRTFSVFDACSGQNVTCDLVFIWTEDTNAPQVLCPNVTADPFEDLGCNPQMINGLPIGLFTTATATDDCLGLVVSLVDFSDDLSVDGCNSTLIRTWSYTDNCDNTGSCSFTYNWAVSAGVTLNCATDPIVVQCGENPSPQVPDASSLCGLAAPVSVSYVEYQTLVLVCNGPIGEYTYVAQDQCGLESTCTQIVEVVSPEPGIACPADVTVACAENISAGIPVITELCGYTSQYLATEPLLVSGVQACDGSVYHIEYTVNNHPCSYTPSCTQVITLVTLSEGLACTDDVTLVDCLEDIVVEDEFFTTSCGEQVLLTAGLPVLTAGNEGCSQSAYTVTISGVLECGQVISCDRIFEILTPDPIVTCPGDMVVECAADVLPGVPVITNNLCDADFTISNLDPLRISRFTGVCNGDMWSITYTVENVDCGGTWNCAQVFTVQNEGPVITCPAVTEIECAEEIQQGVPTVTTSCGLEYTLTSSAPALISGVTDCNGATYQITHIAEDYCGRFDTCYQNFVIANEGIELECPVPTVAACADDIQIINLLAESFCGVELDVENSGIELLSGDGNCTGAEYGVTYSVEDPCGNIAVCTHLWSIVVAGPSIECPDDVTISCLSELVTTGTLSTASDCLSLAPGTTNIELIDGVEGCNESTYEVTYTVADECGGFASCVQGVAVLNDGPEVSCPPAQPISYCGVDSYLPANAMVFPPCNVQPQMAVSTLVNYVGDCTGGYLDVTYTYVDDCNNFDFLCNVIVQPIPAPVAECPVTEIVNNCDVADFEPEILTAILGCGASVDVSGEVIPYDGDCNGGAILVTYTYADVCNTIALECEVEVAPTPPSVIACPDVAPLTTCETFDFEPTTALVSLGCGGTSNVESVGTSFEGTCLIGGILSVVYDYVDDCNNLSTTCDITVLPAPELDITCPVDAIVACPMQIVPGTAFSNSCLAFQVQTIMPAIELEGCTGETLDITYSVMDACGQTASCIQTLSIVNDGPAITCPADLTVDCGEAYTVGSPTAVTSCGVGMEFGIPNLLTDTETACPPSVIETEYTVMDDCGRTDVCVQTVTINIVAPTLSCAAATTAACESDIATLASADIINPCNIVTDLSFELVSDGSLDCPGKTVDVVFSMEDACGNVDECVQVFTIANEAPVIMCPANVTVDCIDGFVPEAAVVTAACGSTAMSSSMTPMLFMGTDGCNGAGYIITHFAVDQCNRPANCVQMVYLENDGPALTCPVIEPVAYCDVAEFEAPLASALPACGAAVDVPGSYVIPAIDCMGGNFDVTYEFMGCDDVMVSCSVSVEIAPAPALACPEMAVVPYCELTAFEAPLAPAISSCGSALEVSGNFVIAHIGCEGGEFDITYEYTDCGMVAAVCTVIVDSAPAPVLSCPVIEAVPYCALTEFVAPVAIVTSCSDVEVGGSFSISGIDCAGGSFDVSYEYVDCGNAMVTCSVTVNVAPAPSLACPVIEPISYCDLSAFVAPVATVVEPCGGTVEVGGSFVIGAIPCEAGGSFDVTYAYTDCGSTSVDCTVIVEPSPATVINCPTSTFVVECADDTGIEDWFAEANAVNGCTGEPIEINVIYNLPTPVCPDLGTASANVVFTAPNPCGGVQLVCAATVDVVYPTPELICTLPENQASCVGETDVTCTNEKGFKTYCFEFVTAAEAAAFEATADPVITVGMDQADLLSYDGGLEVCYKTRTKGSCNIKDFREAYCPGATSSVFSFASVAEVDAWIAGLEVSIEVIGGCDGIMPVVTTDHVPGAECNTDVQVVTFTVTDECGTTGTCALEYQITECDSGCMPCGDIQFTCDPAGAGGVKRFCAVFPSEADADAFVASVNAMMGPIMLGTGNNAVEVVLETSEGGEVCFLSTGQANCDQDNNNAFADFVFDMSGCCNNLVGGAGSSNSYVEQHVPAEAISIEVPVRSIDDSVTTKVYPNPVMGTLYLEVVAAVSAKMKGALFSNMGELVQKIETETLDAGSNLKVVDVSSVTAGTYILRMEIGNRVFFNKVTIVK